MNPLEAADWPYEEEPTEIDNYHIAIQNSLAKTVIAAAQHGTPEHAKEVFKASLRIDRVFEDLLMEVKADGSHNSDFPTLQGFIDDLVSRLNFDSTVFSGCVEKWAKLVQELQMNR
jgi:hypothetical protein